MMDTDLVTSRLEEKYENFFLQNINAADRNGIGNKLRTYALFKKEYKLEAYLKNGITRRLSCNIAKFRTSSHDLLIERGRYTTPPTPAHLRMCKVCNLQVEDEIHFLTKCEGHKQERATLYQNIILLYPHFKNLSEIDKFIFIMMSEDVHVIYTLSRFLVKSNQLRKYLLSQAQNQANWMVWDAVLPYG